MKNFKTTLIILFVFASFISHSQNDKKLSNAKQNKTNVSNTIKKLKNGGAVIYIVKDRKMKTDMLKEKGMEAKALELEAARMKKEKIIVKGLSENFTFCPIYFILQSDLEKIQKGEIIGNLLDTTLTKSLNITFNHSYFLLLDYGDIYDEQGKVYCDTCKSDLTGKTTLKHNAFVFKNIYMSQLSKPFPYYTTCHYPAKEIAIKVKKMNSRLLSFFNRVND